MKNVLYILMLALALSFVGCKKQPYLKVDKPTLSLLSAGGSEQIVIDANYPWTASSSDSWIKIQYTEGENVLKVTVQPNYATDGRQGSISVKSEDLAVVVPVTQAQRDAIELETSGRVEVNAEAQQIDIPLKSNVALTAVVKEGADWISVVSTKSMEAHTVTFSLKANDSKEMRRALVSFQDASGAIAQDLIIDQAGKPRVLRVAFRDVLSFQVPALTGIAGSELFGWAFWDTDTQGIPYDASLSKVYDDRAGSLRIEAGNAQSVTFADVNGVVSIDLSDF
jgi:hypothetical protein